ncbi:MAG: hypothetical protein KDD99_31940 [Bacteroidetes bacterium]|nr:hypothetical protein [Bacteroidota bacterium]
MEQLQKKHRNGLSRVAGFILRSMKRWDRK